jgi:hypothetical protein
VALERLASMRLVHFIRLAEMMSQLALRRNASRSINLLIAYSIISLFSD